MSIFFGTALLVIGVFLIIVIAATADIDEILYGFLSSASLVAIATGILILYTYSNPPITPIDVYQNKTTLQITYKEGVPVDSVVVFKE